MVGIALLVLGAVTLVALALPGQGRLTDWWRDSIVPFFGAGRFLLPFALLVAGWYVEWGPGKEAKAPWGRILIGLAVAYVGFLGVIQILGFSGADRDTGGRIGRALESVLVPLVTTPGAFIIVLGMFVAGLLVMFDTPLRTALAPVAKGVASFRASLRRTPGEDEATGADATRPTAATNGRARTNGKGVAAAPSPGQTGAWAEDDELAIPAAVPSRAQTSNTFAPPRGAGVASATLVAPVRPLRDPDDVTDAGDSPLTKDRIEYALPPIELLEDVALPVQGGGDDAVHQRNEEIIVKKLAGFGIPARVVARNAGPVVTQYEVQPAPDIKVSRIEALADDLAMALAARSLRIEAPIPGKSAVGIEIPNKDFNIVALRRILEEVDFKASGSTLTFALGRDVAGKAQAVDLAKMPHLLIAGATGSGKSVMVNALITSLLCEATPDDVRMILMDLKRVELAAYNGLPHLLVPVITEPERAKAALKWAVNEMEARYRRLAGASARNIRVFNETRADPEDRMPYIVIIIDELADLMMVSSHEVEESITRLAQMARAVGIHLILATQRPSVDVLTGLIKANFPSRISFRVAARVDSRTILDSIGAEHLLGRGDMLFLPPGSARLTRVHGAYVTEHEIARLTSWLRKTAKPAYDDSVGRPEKSGETAEVIERDELFDEAARFVVQSGQASTSMLQRRFRIGFSRAGRLVDMMERDGIIGPADGAKSREVLVAPDYYETVDSWPK
jgi:DNA segregation ATPase FtsK/SpoIIIE-like protein